jgi:hypothetical protein
VKGTSFTFAAVVLFLTTAAFSPARAQNLNSMLQGYYGFKRGGQLIEKDVTVGTTAVSLFQNDQTRYWDLISVTGANNCALGRAANVSITTGVLILANGGSYNEDWVDDGYIVGYQMFAVCAGAGTTLHIQEQKMQ